MHWRRRGRWSPKGWAPDPVAFHQERPVGVQDTPGKESGVRHEAASGSWAGPEHQDTGPGTQTRTAILHPAFDAPGTHPA